MSGFCAAMSVGLCFSTCHLSLYCRLANNQLGKDKADLILQIEANKDQHGAERAVPGNMSSKMLAILTI